MNSPKDYLTDRDKLMEKIERLFDLAQGEEFGNTHAREHFEQEFLTLLTSEVEKTVNKIIGEDEPEYHAYKHPEITNDAWVRNQLRKEQRKALSEIGGGNE